MCCVCDREGGGVGGTDRDTQQRGTETQNALVTFSVTTREPVRHIQVAGLTRISAIAPACGPDGA